VAISLIRELGPVLCALMVTGRVGSAIAAELGSMTASQQIDAMRAWAPIHKETRGPTSDCFDSNFAAADRHRDVVGIVGAELPRPRCTDFQ